jgi:hypothetical protein
VGRGGGLPVEPMLSDSCVNVSRDSESMEATGRRMPLHILHVVLHGLTANRMSMLSFESITLMHTK